MNFIYNKLNYHNILGIADLNPEARNFISRAVSLIFVYVFVVMMTNTFLILHALYYLSIPQLGVVLAVQFAVQALSDYPTGAIGDWIGQRWILFVAALSYAAGFIFLSQVTDFAGILIAFILIALAQSQESGTFISWLDNNYKLIAVEDEDRRIYSHFFGKFTMVYEIITAVSFILGGIIITIGNRQLVFAIQGFLLVLISFVLLFFIRDHKSVKRARDKPDFKSYFQYLGGGVETVIRNKTLRLMVLGLVISGMGFAIWSGLILFPMYAGYAQNSDALTALLRSMIFIFGAIAIGIAGTISKRIHGLQKWLSLAILSTDVLFFTGMFIMLAVNPVPQTFSLVSIIVVILTFTVAFSPRFLADVLKPRFFLDVIPDHNRNAIYSLIPTLILLVSTVAVPLGGILLETIGRETVIIILAGNGLIGSSITAYAIYKHKTVKRMDEEAIDLCCPIFPSKMSDTQAIIPLTLPCCWSFDPVTQYIWNQMKETILQDNIITQDEQNLIESIMFNVKVYGNLIEEAIKNGMIDKEEQEQLLEDREKIWIEAHNIAVEADGLSEDIQNVLTTLSNLLKILDTKRIFKV
ncbi:MAG: MFS transporter [Candidatus Hodarchaeales archaeon]